MQFAGSINPIRARTLQHPGQYDPIRIKSEHSREARHFRLSLEPGRTLYDALVVPLSELDAATASTTVLGGWFSTLQYCVAPPDPRKEAIIRYSAPIDAGESYMVFGNATLGTNMEGAPMVHCHAALKRSDGAVMGGHIIPEETIVGDVPISVLVTAMDDFSLRQALDPETCIPLFQPFARS